MGRDPEVRPEAARGATQEVEADLGAKGSASEIGARQSGQAEGGAPSEKPAGTKGI